VGHPRRKDETMGITGRGGGVARLVGLGFGLINGLMIEYGNLVPFIASWP